MLVVQDLLQSLDLKQILIAAFHLREERLREQGIGVCDNVHQFDLACLIRDVLPSLFMISQALSLGMTRV